MGEIQLEATVTALQPLHEVQKKLFDTIDELRTLGVGKIVDLPQIIVVGDQSSGKSSVLEAISRVRFPVEDGVCTRFATELVLRNAPHTAVEVIIERKGEDLSKFSEDKLRSLDKKDDITQIIDEAKKRMGIDYSSKRFSTDILRIKISAPDVPDLTLVDLPGFYHSGGQGQSTDDKKIVNELVGRYMRQKSSIILTVVSAGSKTFLQTVLDEIKEPDVDPRRERTLGVITHPDKLDRGSSQEKRYLELARNEDPSHILKYKWHVLRNRSEGEVNSSDKERDATEKDFFESSVWSNFPAENKGIAKLREKLSKILFDHITDSLPSVISDIERSIAERKAELKMLGDPRPHPPEQRLYLNGIASRFERLALDAIQGKYMDRPFFGDLRSSANVLNPGESPVRKLRAVVRNLNRACFIVMHSKGASRSIQWEDGAEMEIQGVGNITASLQTLIDEYYHFEDPTPVSEADLKAEVVSLAAQNEGCDFPGEPNHKVTLMLFEDQAKRWREIATRHIELLTGTAKDFVEGLLEHVVKADPRTRERILEEFVEPFFQEKNEGLKNKLEELLPYPEKTGYLLPLEHEFVSRSEGRTMTRLNKQFEAVEKRHDVPVSGRNKDAILNNHKFTQAYIDHHNGKQSMSAAEKMIDHMVAYYELYLRIFTENVVMLAIENQLIREIPKIFTTENVAAMDEAMLKALAAELDEITRRRETLQNQVDQLNKGLDLCRSCRRRKRAAVSSTIPNMHSVTSLRPTPRQSVEPEEEL